MHHFSSGRRAFTLVEMLIVISIIAILSAILFPAFTRARESARKASCQSNMKQVALGFAQYEQDYDERLPGAWALAGGEGQPNGWTFYSHFDAVGKDSVFAPALGSLQPYLKNGRMFLCPADPNNERGPQSYALSSCVLNAAAPTDAVSWGKALAEFDSAHLWIMLAEEGQGGASTNDGLVSPANGDTAALRHFDGANYAFVDGHVKWLRPGSVAQNFLWTGGTDQMSSCWAPS